MGTASFIKQMEDMGIHLWVEDEKLKFRAPEGVVDEKIRESLKANKQAIIVYFKDRMAPVHEEENRYDFFELTDIQASYLLGSSDAYGLGETGCTVYAVLDTPRLDEKKLNAALEQVVRRHDMLHADVYRNGKQKVKKEIPDVTVRTINLSEKEDADFEEYLKEEQERSLGRKFEAEKWPFFEITLVHGKERDKILLLVDMLVADFASMRILVTELEDAYFERELLPIEITFRDYLIWKKRNQSHKKKEDAKKYWEDRLDSLPEAPELPVVMGDSDGTGFSQNSWLVPKESWDKICDIAKKHSLTPSNLLLTAYSEVIGLYSRQQDFTLNITLSDRPDVHKDMARIIGDFTIVDLLEVHNGNRESFFKKAETLQKQLFKDLENKEYTGVEVMRAINKKKEKAQLFPVVYTSTIGASTVEDTAAFGLEKKITKTPQVLIDCQVASVKESVLISWDVREDAFPKGMIDDMFSMFCDRITLLADDGLEGEYVSLELPEKTEIERNMVNSTKAEASDELLHDGITENIKTRPESIAVISSKESITYKELGRRATAICHVLQNAGVRKGDIVAVNLEKSVWQPAAVLGILWSGGAYLPLGVDQPKERKETILSKSGAKFCVTENDTVLDGATCIYTNDIEAGEECVPEEVRVDGSDVAYIIYTSGSTGLPKGVVITHHAAKNTIDDINERFGINENDRVLAVANLAFDLSVYDIFGVLTAGGTVVIPDQDKMKDPKHLEEMVSKYEVTIWNSVPAQMQMLVYYIKTLPEKKNYSLRLALMSGDWIPVTLPAEIKDQLPNTKCISLGGATEASIWSIYYEIDPSVKYDRSIPYGYPLRNQYFRIMNDNICDCPDYVPGEIMIGGMGLAKEYHNDLDQTNASFIVHPSSKERLYRTGDVGRYLPGGLIEFMGRKDTQVKINGHRIELSEIESNLQECEDVDSVAVITDDNSIVAFIQPVAIAADGSNSENSIFISEAVKKTCEAKSSNVDAKLFREWTDAADATAVFDILNALRTRGVFDEDRGYSIEEINERIHVHQAYRGMLIQWLEALMDENLVERNSEDGTYRLTERDIKAKKAEETWNAWKAIDKKLNYSPQMMKYFGEMRDNLLPIMEGSLDPLDVYLPKGDSKNYVAAYHDNIVSDVLNAVMVSALTEIVSQKEKNGEKIRILEIGAGMGGAGRELIPTLENKNVEYIYTDIAQFYLNEAKKLFGNYKFINYMQVDMNKPVHTQNIDRNSIDVVIFSNSIHYADSISNTLSNLRSVMRENGVLIISDTTKMHKSVLTSVSFNAGFGENLISVEDYLDIFDKEKIVINGVFPEKGSSIDCADKHVFIGTYSSEKKIDIEKVKESLESVLPEYMIPDKYVIVEQMPLSRNGKVDRARLSEILQEEANSSGNGEGDLPVGELEEQIEKIWAGALNREYMFRNENFYQAGGDSLLIAQVVAEMKEKIPEAKDIEWDALMRGIIETPTIMEVASKLSGNEKKNTDSDEDENGISIFVQGEEKKKIKVLIHDGTGTIYPYQNLIPYLKDNAGQNETIIGITNTNASDYKEVKTEEVISKLGLKYGKMLAEMDYFEYEIIGFCFGGIVAVETAKYLMQEGKNVLPVKTIDTPYCDRHIRSDFLMERTFAMSLGISYEESGYPGEDKDLVNLFESLLEEQKEITDEVLCSLHGEYEKLGNVFRYLAKDDQETRLKRLYEICRKNSGERFNQSEKEFMENYEISKTCFESMSIYEELYMGDVTDLFCSDDKVNFFPMLGGHGGTFWKERVLGNLEEIPIEGNHDTCMKEPIIADVAKILLDK